jgi:sugar-specific transcriptional regulator TrmB
LKSLTKKGLVSYAPKGKRRYFKAEDPHKLIDLANEQQNTIAQTKLQLETSIVPQLIQSTQSYEIPQVSYYEGDDGVEQILRDVLQSVEQSKTKTYSVYSAKPMRRYLYRNFPNFTKQRITKGLSVNVIAIGDGGEEVEFSKRKWLPLEKGAYSTSYILIYPPKYSIISLAQEDYPYGVIINEPSITFTQQFIFDSLWKTL